MRNSRPIPAPAPRVAQFERLGYGLFLHWGLYSQLGRGEWVMHHERIPAPRYNRLARTFTAVDFDARAWAQLAREAGMRYIALTTRHHEGFSLYDTRGLSDFDALHTRAGRDLVAEFVAACRAEDIVPFFYHTTLDWQWQSQRCDQKKFEAYLDYLHASVELLCRHYGPIGGFWFDGNWSRPEADWKENRLYRMIRRHQPEAMIINNTGVGARGALGHPELDSTTFEHGLPSAPDRRGWPKYLAGEMCQTMNSHWGIGARDFSHLSPAQIIEQLARCRKVGANYLLNAGPQAQGGIPEYEAATLRRAGAWVALYQDILRHARPAPDIVCPGSDFVLRSPDGKVLYYFAFALPVRGMEHLGVPGSPGLQRAVSGWTEKVRRARWLDSGEALGIAQERRSGLLALQMAGQPYGTQLVVRVAALQVA